MFNESLALRKWFGRAQMVSLQLMSSS